MTDLLGTNTVYARPTTASITGVAEDAASAARLALAPTPAHHSVALTLAAPAAPGTPALLLDGLGRVVRSEVLPVGSTGHTLDLNGLRAGLYWVRVGADVRQLVVSE